MSFSSFCHRLVHHGQEVTSLAREVRSAGKARIGEGYERQVLLLTQTSVFQAHVVVLLGIAQDLVGLEEVLGGGCCHRSCHHTDGCLKPGCSLGAWPLEPAQKTTKSCALILCDRDILALAFFREADWLLLGEVLSVVNLPMILPHADDLGTTVGQFITVSSCVPFSEGKGRPQSVHQAFCGWVFLIATSQQIIHM